MCIFCILPLTGRITDSHLYIAWKRELVSPLLYLQAMIAMLAAHRLLQMYLVLGRQQQQVFKYRQKLMRRLWKLSWHLQGRRLNKLLPFSGIWTLKGLLSFFILSTFLGNHHLIRERSWRFSLSFGFGKYDPAKGESKWLQLLQLQI